MSVRLSTAVEEFLVAEARRTRQPKSSILNSLAEEATRCRLFPGVAFRGLDWSRRPWVVGTGLDVWQIVDAYRGFGSIQRMVAETELTERQIRVALAYCERFPEEIEGAIDENRRALEELRRLYPGLALE